MSEVTNSINQNNFQGFDYDYAKIFLFNVQTDKATFKNNTGVEQAFAAGTLLARDSSDDTIVPLLSTNTLNGANLPVGVLMSPVASLADAATSTGATFAFKGEVASDKVILQGADTYTTVIAEGGNRTIKDLMTDRNLIPRVVDELTRHDNS